MTSSSYPDSFNSTSISIFPLAVQRICSRVGTIEFNSIMSLNNISLTKLSSIVSSWKQIICLSLVRRTSNSTISTFDSIASVIECTVLSGLPADVRPL